MFYTKGDSYLLSIRETLIQGRNRQDKETQRLYKDNDHFPSSVVHFFIACFDNLPTFLWMASLLSILSYLYTIFLLPVIMTAAVPSNVTNVFHVPLDIQCPFLTPRAPATSVHDLRPDDIRVVAGIGDR